MDLELRTIQGGKLEFYKTGVYRSELYFSSQELNSSWSIRWTHDNHNGNLKLNGNVVFNFSFTNRVCKVQKVTNGSAGDWVQIEVIGIMCD